jgi:O-antigen/teichoic acid export membrane protein
VQSLISPLHKELGTSGPFRPIAANTAWLLFDRLARVLLGLTVGAWIARYLGPARFGELSYVIAVIALFQAIANIGADAIVVRDIAHAPERASAILGTAIRIRLCVGLICWLLAAVTVTLIDRGEREILWMTVVVGGALVFQAADTIDLWFQSQSRSYRTVAAKLTAYTVSNGVKVVLIVLHAPLFAFACAMSLDFMLAALGLAIAYRGFPTPVPWRACKTMAIELIRESWPFLIAGVSVVVSMRIDQVMLKNLLSERELGLYSAAVPLSQVWNVIPVVLTTSLAPYVAKRKQHGEAEYRRTLSNVFRLYGAFGLVVSLLTTAVAPWLIHVMYGGTFERSARVLSIHVLSNVFIFLGVAQSLWIVNERVGRIGLYKCLSGGAVSLIGNWLFIPRFGIVGCAAVYVAAQFVAAVGSNYILAPEILSMQIRGVLLLPARQA